MINQDRVVAAQHTKCLDLQFSRKELGRSGDKPTHVVRIGHRTEVQDSEIAVHRVLRDDGGISARNLEKARA
ncbi:MAG: hypothetical protein C4293_11300 [Nitrospiraceae bacterium]